ncbi:hypothetical protein CANCADRAFT_13954, partial [Tortispora caseinolytica NRRL Y-17796]
PGFIVPESGKSFEARLTVKHWQLRNLITPSCHDPNEVYYVSGTAINALNLKNGRSNVLMNDLPFEPRCISSGFGYVLAGGVNHGHFALSKVRQDPIIDSFDRSSQLMFPEFNKNRIGANSLVDHGRPHSHHSFSLGGYINNAITLYSTSPSEANAIICNNDRTLHIIRLTSESYAPEQVIQVPVPPNHASISPDKKTIAIVGDSSELYLLHAEEKPNWSRGCSSTKWTPVGASFNDSDCGFSSAFSPSGSLLAISSQDGLAFVYDTRYMPSLTRRPSSLTAPRGAFRCLKFSNSYLDMLAITEQFGRVHLVDTRNFSNSSVL